MPGFLLHEGAVVMCMHGGQAEPTVPDMRVRLSGMPAAWQTVPWVIEGCTLPPPPAANGPCATAVWETAAVRVKSMGIPLLLFDSMSICAISGTPLRVVETQIRVKGI
jgi:hypothetical protein